MSKWKCEICNKEFENFHAQGFNHKIYCPLCYFKEENRQLQQENKELKEHKKQIINYITEHKQHEYRNGKNDEMYLELNQLELNELLHLIWKGDK